MRHKKADKPQFPYNFPWTPHRNGFRWRTELCMKPHVRETYPQWYLEPKVLLLAIFSLQYITQGGRNPNWFSTTNFTQTRHIANLLCICNYPHIKLFQGEGSDQRATINSMPSATWADKHHGNNDRQNKANAQILGGIHKLKPKGP